jgi:hypothetical protein
MRSGLEERTTQKIVVDVEMWTRSTCRTGTLERPVKVKVFWFLVRYRYGKKDRKKPQILAFFPW